MKRFGKSAMTSVLSAAVFMAACVGCVPEESAEIPMASTDPNDKVIDVAIETVGLGDWTGNTFAELNADASHADAANEPGTENHESEQSPESIVVEPFGGTPPAVATTVDAETPTNIDDESSDVSPPPAPDLAGEFREELSGNRAYWVKMVGDPAQGSNWIGYRNTLKLCESGFYELKVEAIRPGMITNWTSKGIWSVLNEGGVPMLALLPLHSTLGGDLQIEAHPLERLDGRLIIVGESDMALSPLADADTELCDRLVTDLTPLLPE